MKRQVVMWKFILNGSNQNEGCKCKRKEIMKENLSDTWVEKKLI